jgi:hypothetical protein
MNVTIIGTHHSLVPCTNKCGWAISCLDQSIIVTSQKIYHPTPKIIVKIAPTYQIRCKVHNTIINMIHLSQFATEFQSGIFLSREVGLRNKDEV